MKETAKHTVVDIFNKYDNKYNLTADEFKEICRTFNNVLMKALVDTGYEYKFPLKLGTISIKKSKTSGSKIDFNHYAKTGEKIKHTNNHSQGYYAAFNWSKTAPYGIFEDKHMFKFFPSRFHKRHLAESIRERNTINKYFAYD